jgi:hypothetical protein
MTSKEHAETLSRADVEASRRAIREARAEAERERESEGRGDGMGRNVFKY